IEEVRGPGIGAPQQKVGESFRLSGGVRNGSWPRSGNSEQCEFIQPMAVHNCPQVHHLSVKGGVGRIADSRCGSATPLRACSPRSSNATPAEVRASERTVSDTSTSPGADAPAIRA